MPHQRASPQPDRKGPLGPAARSSATHQTLKPWLRRQAEARTLTGSAVQLDVSTDYYNTADPTGPSALARRPKPSPPPKGLPPSSQLIADGHYRVRHDRIDASG